MDGIEPSLLPYDEDERSAIGGARRRDRKRDPRSLTERVRARVRAPVHATLWHSVPRG